MGRSVRVVVCAACFFIAGISTSVFAQNPPATCVRTFYVDYVGGSDSNNGTSASTPWQRSPGMTAFAGTYTHAAGDCFVFKGGVTWPNAALQLHITNSGTSANPDYYGVSQSFFTGASWTRPIFNGGGATVSGVNASLISLNSVSNVTVDDIECTNQFIPGSSLNEFCVNATSCSGLDIKNMYAHSWSVASASVGGGNNGGISVNPPDAVLSTNNVVEFNTITGPTITTGCGNGSPCSAGTGVVGASICRNNVVSNIPGGISGCINFIGNTIHDILPSINDPISHEDAMFVFKRADQTQTVSGNLVYRVCCGEAIFIAPALGSGGSPHILVYNNVSYQSGMSAPPGPIEFDWTDTTCSDVVTIEVYNNTFQMNGSTRIQVTQQTCAITTLTMKNNHYITDNASPICVNESGCGSVTNFTNSSYVLQTNATATAQGYTVSNNYAPTSALGGTVGAAANLFSLGISALDLDIRGFTRPNSGAWDAGAYQYATTPAPNPPSGLSAVVQ